VEWWGTIISTVKELGNYAIHLVKWSVKEGESLAQAVDLLVVTLWRDIAGIIRELGGKVIHLVKWAVTEGESLAQAVDLVVVTLWRDIAGIIRELGGKVIHLVKWAVSEGDSLAGAVVDLIAKIWPDIASTGVKIGNYTVHLWKWLTDEVTSGDLVKTVGDWVKDALKDMSVAISNYKINVTAPDSKNITIDVGGIMTAVWDKLTTYPTYDPGTTGKAQDFGQQIAQKFIGFVLDGIKSIFAGGGSNDPNRAQHREHQSSHRGIHQGALHWRVPARSLGEHRRNPDERLPNHRA